MQRIDMRLETSTIRVVHESIVQSFKTHKKFIEKAITNAVNNLTKVHKQNKGRDSAVTGLKAQVRSLESLKKSYMGLIDTED
jgi:histidinol dehydrogenase